MDERSKEYGDWMMVTRRKLMSKAKISYQTQSASLVSDASQGQGGKSSPRVDELSKKDGKRKVPSPASSGSQRAADKTAKPVPRKDGVKSDSFSVKSRMKATKQGSHLV